MNLSSPFAAAILAFVACATVSTSANGQKLTDSTEKPIVSWSGSDSHVQKQQILRISTERDWIDLWLSHTGQQVEASEEYNTWLNNAGVPSVDFSQYMVIAIFDGKGFNCAGFTDATIKQSAKEMIFRFDFKSYGTDGDGDAVSVYGLYVVPKSVKPITIQFPEPVLKGAPPSGNWEAYGRIAEEK